MKRAIINGMMGSSWRFKIFERLSVIVTSHADPTVLF